MKNINNTIKDVQRLLDKNSPVILTGMALFGMGASVFYTYKGAQKGTRAIDASRTKPGFNPGEAPELTNQEKFLLTYKFYAPAAVAVVGTGACMVMATKIGLNRTAALGAALVVAERGSDQYRDKVKEILGENKDIKVVDAIANDQVAAMPAGYLPPPREGEQTFVDGWSGRAISSTMETVKKAINDANKEILDYSYISLTDFYESIGLDAIQESGSIGWSSEHLLDVSFTSVLKDDRAVVVMTFKKAPTATFRDGH
jgi:hypothetical protein